MLSCLNSHLNWLLFILILCLSFFLIQFWFNLLLRWRFRALHIVILRFNFEWIIRSHLFKLINKLRSLHRALLLRLPELSIRSQLSIVRCSLNKLAVRLNLFKHFLVDNPPIVDPSEIFVYLGLLPVLQLQFVS